MSLDATPVRLTTIGTVTIDKDGITVSEGFDGEKCSCRDVAVLAMAWAIGELQRELLATIEKPGGSGRCGIG